MPSWRKFISVVYLLSFSRLIDASIWEVGMFPRVSHYDLSRSTYKRGNAKAHVDKFQSVVAESSENGVAFDVVLQELKELESQPLCHRTAARFLVTDCQLLQGKDDSSVILDSGRQIRDFIDAYAASLALCDLERGDFAIPKSCDPLREASLTQLPRNQYPHLHITTKEIDSCLHGLSQSDSAWTTWVSYRHKALRFCEAASKEYEKDKSIKTYSLVTKAMANLVRCVDSEFNQVVTRLHQRLQDADTTTSHLEAQLHGIYKILDDTMKLAVQSISTVASQSDNAVASGRNAVSQLRESITALVNDIKMDKDKEIQLREDRMREVVAHVHDETNGLTHILTSLYEATSSLSLQLDHSRSVGNELAQQQHALEKSLGKLLEQSEEISAKLTSQSEFLESVTEATELIAKAYERFHHSTAIVMASLHQIGTILKLWPLFIFPIITVTLGSKGLKPSVTHNLLLIMLGLGSGFIFIQLRYSIQLPASS